MANGAIKCAKRKTTPVISTVSKYDKAWKPVIALRKLAFVCFAVVVWSSWDFAAAREVENENKTHDRWINSGTTTHPAHYLMGGRKQENKDVNPVEWKNQGEPRAHTHTRK